MRKKEFIRPLSNEDRIRENFSVDKGKVERIVVQYESYITDKWAPIVRFDTAHDFFHKDIINPDKTKVQIRISSFNLNDALTYAELDLKNNWQRYKTQYLEKIKNE
jgi:LEA14-like dessication related protein